MILTVLWPSTWTQKDALHPGRKPREATERLTVKNLVNTFLNAKQALVDGGELSPRTWAMYKAPQNCEPVAPSERVATDGEWRPGSGNWFRPGPWFQARALGLWPDSGSGVWSDPLREAGKRLPTGWSQKRNAMTTCCSPDPDGTFGSRDASPRIHNLLKEDAAREGHPMIRFSCPVCQMMMEAPEERAGSQVACLQCQQQLVIPPPARTVLATTPGAPSPRPSLSGFLVAGVFLGVASLPLALFVGPVYVGMGVAILAAGLASVGTFASLRGEGGGVGFAVSILLLCASALFTGYGSFTLNERQATNRGLVEQAEALKRDAGKTLEEAKEREAKAERAPKRAQELLRKAVEAEERAQEAPAKAQIILDKAQEVRAQAISEPLKLKAEAQAALEKARATLEKAKAERAQADQANEKALRSLEQAKAQAAEGERKANLLLKEAATKQQEAGELHKQAVAERAKSQSLLKEALDKNKQTEETYKKTQALLDGAVMTLKSDNDEVRLKAAAGLVRLKVRIAEASRALCEVAVFATQRQRKDQALRLLEKARPELYKPVVTLATPSTDQRAGHITAVQAIAKLGPDGNAATTVVLRQLQASAAHVQETGSQGYPLVLAKTCLAALVTIAPAELEVTKAMVGIAQTRAEVRNRALDELRIDTLLTLRGIATGNPKTAKGLVPCFLAAVNDDNTSIRLLGIEALGRIGEQAKEAVPTLRELRNDPIQAIRTAAAAALKKIQPGEN